MNSGDDINELTENSEKSEIDFPVIGIGASAGGLKAFTKFVEAIPKNSGMAYVFVQHLSPTHESHLPEILKKGSKIPVLNITDNIHIEKDTIYIIPSNKILIATDGVLKLHARPHFDPTKKDQAAQRNMTIDLFFESLSLVHQSNAIGVVLSGTANDGTRGLKCIKEQGGITFAQDEQSAQYEGMPQSAVDAGVVDFILPPEEIPDKILQLKNIIEENVSSNGNKKEKDEVAFAKILALLKVRKNNDFTYYKQSTIRRRIYRRMALNKIITPDLYVSFLQKHKSEQDILYQDFLIPVTSFFRDTSVFETLCKEVFPALERQKINNEAIRIWVAGCSTGAEAYSMAICLKEILGQRNRKVQIFATDISEPAINKARSGLYNKSDLDAVSTERLQEFFIKKNSHYQVKKNIRDICVFAVHNFLKDPPFGKMDIISCRNVLIYMEPYLQRKAMTTFHYGLNPLGFLVLGKSETNHPASGLFEPAKLAKTNNDKIYTPKETADRALPMEFGAYKFTSVSNDATSVKIKVTDFQKAADEILLKKFTPAGVVVDEQLDIVYFRGRTENYLQQASGKPTHNLLKMAKEGLGFEIRNILHKVKSFSEANKYNSFRKDNIQIKIEGQLNTVSLEAMRLPDTIDSYYLILFHEENREGERRKVYKHPPNDDINVTAISKDEQVTRIKQLEKELEQNREDMRSITEDQEAINEELQSANEELLSSSEELQSLNEELETGKEELQSTNEELVLVNQEMLVLNNEITEALHYAESVIATIREPLLILDKDLRIKSANKNFYKTFLVNELETEGRSIFELGNGQWNIPALKNLLEKVLPTKSKVTDLEITAEFNNLGKRIMLINASEIVNKSTTEKLILLAIEDVTERRNLEEKEKELNDIFMNMVVHAPLGMMVLRGPTHYVEIVNEPALKLIGKASKDILNKSLRDAIPGVENTSYINILNEVYRKGERFVSAEQKVNLKHISNTEVCYLNFVFDPFKNHAGTITGVVVICNEVTAQVLARKVIEENEKKFHLIADIMPEKIWTADADGNKDYFNNRYLAYTGLKQEDLIGWGWKNVIHPTDWPDNLEQWINSINTGNDYESMIRLLNADGQYRRHISRASALKDENGRVIRWVGTKTEIHSVKEEEEKRANFIKMVSHELKTPVTSIKGYVQLLQMVIENSQDITYPEPVKSTLNRIDKLIMRLTRLISEMLDLSRLESGQMEFHPEKFDLQKLINEVVEDCKQLNQKQEIRVVKRISCQVVGDKNQIEQVMVNLLANAAKYSPPHTEVFVRTEMVNEDTVMVSIEDKGIGIDKEEQEKIFERFYRVSGKNEETYPGFGIGLFISKEMITRHGGELTLQSEKNKGSVFSFTLPCISN